MSTFFFVNRRTLETRDSNMTMLIMYLLEENLKVPIKYAMYLSLNASIELAVYKDKARYPLYP